MGSVSCTFLRVLVPGNVFVRGLLFLYFVLGKFKKTFAPMKNLLHVGALWCELQDVSPDTESQRRGNTVCFITKGQACTPVRVWVMETSVDLMDPFYRKILGGEESVLLTALPLCLWYYATAVSFFLGS